MFPGNTLMHWYLEWVSAVACKPGMRHVREEWNEMCAERMLISLNWWRELGDVLHTILRMLHPYAGIIIVPVARKHGYRMKYGRARIKD